MQQEVSPKGVNRSRHNPLEALIYKARSSCSQTVPRASSPAGRHRVRMPVEQVKLMRSGQTYKRRRLLLHRSPKVGNMGSRREGIRGIQRNHDSKTLQERKGCTPEHLRRAAARLAVVN